MLVSFVSLHRASDPLHYGCCSRTLPLGLRKVGLRAVAREFKRRHAAALVVVPPPPAPEPTASRHHRNRR